MRFDVSQRQRQQRRERFVGRRTVGEVIGLEMPDGLRLCAPADEQQSRAVAAGLIGVRRERGNRVGLAIGSTERRGTSVHLLITAQRRVVHQRRRWTDSLRMFVVMNAMFAGRSARRRIRYGYQCVPNGTYTRML